MNICQLHQKEPSSVPYTEGTAWHSASGSLRCRWHPVLLALLPACAGARIISCQGVTASAMRTLQTTCLVGVSHPHAPQALPSSSTLHGSVPKATGAQLPAESTVYLKKNVYVAIGLFLLHITDPSLLCRSRILSQCNR